MMMDPSWISKGYWVIGKLLYLPHILIPVSFYFLLLWNCESFLNFLTLLWDTNTLPNMKMDVKALKKWVIFCSRWYLIPFSEYNSITFEAFYISPFFHLSVCVLCLELRRLHRSVKVLPILEEFLATLGRRSMYTQNARWWGSICLEQEKLSKNIRGTLHVALE